MQVPITGSAIFALIGAGAAWIGFSYFSNRAYSLDRRILLAIVAGAFVFAIDCLLRSLIAHWTHPARIKRAEAQGGAKASGLPKANQEPK